MSAECGYLLNSGSGQLNWAHQLFKYSYLADRNMNRIPNWIEPILLSKLQQRAGKFWALSSPPTFQIFIFGGATKKQIGFPGPHHYSNPWNWSGPETATRPGCAGFVGLKACLCLNIMTLSAFFIKWQYTNFMIGYNFLIRKIKHGWALSLHTWCGRDGGCFGATPILWITIIMGAGKSYLLFCCSAKYEYLIKVFFQRYFNSINFFGYS